MAPKHAAARLRKPPETSLRRRGERTTMIWSRWPLREVPVFTDLPDMETPPRVWPSYTVSSRDTAPAVCAIVDIPGKPLLVYGTIITYFGDRGPSGQSKQRAISEKLSEEEVAALVQELQKQGMVIVTQTKLSYNLPM